ncbi:MAG: 50S ribosomal protein L9 [Verrucomicrobia bacterium GWC2_42_7]|nr:MAG: 50S ribosomal protein L9 [Verrucomicrobia bacterium GWC2_42_7]
MANAAILLLKPLEGLGGEGDQVTVKAGYARNFLLPQGMAIPVTRSNKKQIESLQKARAVREAKELENAQGLAEKLKNARLTIAVKTGAEGKVFGSVTANDLIARLKDDGIELEKKKIHLRHPAKTLGKHAAQVKLHADLVFDLEFEVVSENPIEAKS